MSDFFGFIVSSVKDIQIADILDIAVVSVFTYIIIKFLRETRAAQFIKGILVVLIFWQLSDFLSLYATHYIINSLLDFGIFAILILFQPELRSMLESVGRKGFKGFSFLNTDDERRVRDTNMMSMISAIADATTNLAITKTGALMVIERDTKLGEIIKTGTIIEADSSSTLIRNLFYPKAPLHDGAVIFRNGRVHAAGCFLPLSTRDMGNDLGTRHHAALGMSEVSDAVVVVVSEETGIISVAVNGTLNRRITPDALVTILKKYLIPNEEKKKDFFGSLIKGKKSDKDGKK